MENEKQQYSKNFVDKIKNFQSGIRCSDEDIVRICRIQYDLKDDMPRDELKKLFNDFFDKLDDDQQHLYNEKAIWEMKPRVERPSKALIEINGILDKYVENKLMTATEISEILGMLPYCVNLILVKKNVIRKSGRKYEFTKAGKKYGENFLKVDGVLKKVKNLRYYESVIDLLRSDDALEADDQEEHQVDNSGNLPDKNYVVSVDYDDYDDLPF